MGMSCSEVLQQRTIARGERQKGITTILSQRESQLKELYYLLSISKNVESLLLEPDGPRKAASSKVEGGDQNVDLQRFLNQHSFERGSILPQVPENPTVANIERVLALQEPIEAEEVAKPIPFTHKSSPFFPTQAERKRAGKSSARHARPKRAVLAQKHGEPQRSLTSADWMAARRDTFNSLLLSRIASLKTSQSWAGAQLARAGPKSRTKAHWDYLLESVRSRSKDMKKERRWKIMMALLLAEEAVKYVSKKAELKADESVMNVDESPTGPTKSPSPTRTLPHKRKRPFWESMEPPTFSLGRSTIPQVLYEHKVVHQNAPNTLLEYPEPTSDAKVQTLFHDTIDPIYWYLSKDSGKRLQLGRTTEAALSSTILPLGTTSQKPSPIPSAVAAIAADQNIPQDNRPARAPSEPIDENADTNIKFYSPDGTTPENQPMTWDADEDRFLLAESPALQFNWFLISSTLNSHKNRGVVALKNGKSPARCYYRYLKLKGLDHLYDRDNKKDKTQSKEDLRKILEKETNAAALSNGGDNHTMRSTTERIARHLKTVGRIEAVANRREAARKARVESIEARRKAAAAQPANPSPGKDETGEPVNVPTPSELTDERVRKEAAQRERQLQAQAVANAQYAARQQLAVAMQRNQQMQGGLPATPGAPMNDVLNQQVRLGYQQLAASARPNPAVLMMMRAAAQQIQTSAAAGLQQQIATSQPLAHPQVSQPPNPVPNTAADQNGYYAAIAAVAANARNAQAGQVRPQMPGGQDILAQAKAVAAAAGANMQTRPQIPAQFMANFRAQDPRVQQFLINQHRQAQLRQQQQQGPLQQQSMPGQQSQALSATSLPQVSQQLAQAQLQQQAALQNHAQQRFQMQQQNLNQQRMTSRPDMSQTTQNQQPFNPTMNVNLASSMQGTPPQGTIAQQSMPQMANMSPSNALGNTNRPPGSVPIMTQPRPAQSMAPQVSMPFANPVSLPAQIPQIPGQIGQMPNTAGLNLPLRPGAQQMLPMMNMNHLTALQAQAQVQAVQQGKSFPQGQPGFPFRPPNQFTQQQLLQAAQLSSQLKQVPGLNPALQFGQAAMSMLPQKSVPPFSSSGPTPSIGQQMPASSAAPFVSRHMNTTSMPRPPSGDLSSGGGFMQPGGMQNLVATTASGQAITGHPSPQQMAQGSSPSPRRTPQRMNNNTSSLSPPGINAVMGNMGSSPGQLPQVTALQSKFGQLSPGLAQKVQHAAQQQQRHPTTPQPGVMNSATPMNPSDFQRVKLQNEVQTAAAYVALQHAQQHAQASQSVSQPTATPPFQQMFMQQQQMQAMPSAPQTPMRPMDGMAPSPAPPGNQLQQVKRNSQATYTPSPTSTSP